MSKRCTGPQITGTDSALKFAVNNITSFLESVFSTRSIRLVENSSAWNLQCLHL